MDCVTDNTVKIIKGDNFEVKQVEPNFKTVTEYQAQLTSSIDRKMLMDMSLLSEELKTAGKKRKEEIEKEMEKISSSNADDTGKVTEAYNLLILGSLKGSFFESGYFKVKGEELEVTKEFIEDLPKNLYVKLRDNAIELITVDNEAIEKN